MNVKILTIKEKSVKCVCFVKLQSERISFVLRFWGLHFDAINASISSTLYFICIEKQKRKYLKSHFAIKKK